MKNPLKKEKILILAPIPVFLVAVLLRLYKIDQLDLWRDEAFTAILATKSVTEIIRTLTCDTTPPLLEIILHFYLKIFPTSELTLRLPSLLFSLGGQIYMYLLTRKIFKRVNVLLILTLMSVNMVSIFYAREARAYALLSFLLSASLYHLINLCEKFSTINALAFLITTILAIYSHNIALTFLVAEIIFLFWKIRPRQKDKLFNRKWLLLFSFLSILILPWLSILLGQARKVGGEYWVTFYPLRSIGNTLTDLATGIRLFTFEDFSLLDQVLQLISILLLLTGTYSEMKDLRRKQFPFSFFFWIPFLLIYITSFQIPLLYVRYTSFLTPFMLILIFKGILFFVKKDLLKVVLTGLIITLNLNIYFGKYINDTSTKPHYKELTNYLGENFSENDGIIHIGPLSFLPYQYYASEQEESTIYDPYHKTPFYAARSLLKEEKFTRDLPSIYKYDRLWTIELKPVSFREDFYTEEFYSKYEESEENVFPGNLYLILWEKR